MFSGDHGGVGVPVSSCGFDPVDGCAGGEVEHFGHDGSGELGSDVGEGAAPLGDGYTGVTGLSCRQDRE